jgi:hypothetical protein
MVDIRLIEQKYYWENPLVKAVYKFCGQDPKQTARAFSWIKRKVDEMCVDISGSRINLSSYFFKYSFYQKDV